MSAPEALGILDLVEVFSRGELLSDVDQDEQTIRPAPRLFDDLHNPLLNLPLINELEALLCPAPTSISRTYTSSDVLVETDGLRSDIKQVSDLTHLRKRF